MGTRTVVRFRQGGSAFRQAYNINLAHIASSIVSGLSGAYGTVRVNPEVAQVKNPLPVNWLTVVVDTQQDINWQTRGDLVQRLNASVNGANEGVWSYSEVLNPVLSMTHIQTSNAADPAVTAGNIAGNGAPSAGAEPPPPPRHNQRPLASARGAIVGARVISTTPARNGLTTNAADAAAPPASPENGITLGSVLPIIGAALGLGLVGYGIYHVVRK